jgi:hypothetical protein
MKPQRESADGASSAFTPLRHVDTATAAHAFGSEKAKKRRASLQRSAKKGYEIACEIVQVDKESREVKDAYLQMLFEKKDRPGDINVGNSVFVLKADHSGDGSHADSRCRAASKTGRKAETPSRCSLLLSCAGQLSSPFHFDRRELDR